MGAFLGEGGDAVASEAGLLVVMKWRASGAGAQSERLDSDAPPTIAARICPTRNLEFHPRHTTHKQHLPPVQNWNERPAVEIADALALSAYAKGA